MWLMDMAQAAMNNCSWLRRCAVVSVHEHLFMKHKRPCSWEFYVFEWIVHEQLMDFGCGELCPQGTFILLPFDRSGRGVIWSNGVPGVSDPTVLISLTQLYHGGVG
jgi:hypothetical protein